MSRSAAARFSAAMYFLDFALAHKIQIEKRQGTTTAPVRSKQRPSWKEVTPRVTRVDER
jgi:hypothetical protein